MARVKRRKTARRATNRVYRAKANYRRRRRTANSAPRRRRRRASNPGMVVPRIRRVYVRSRSRRRSNARRRSRNPALFHGMKPMQVLEGAAGVLAGIGATRAIVAMLPASFTSSNLASAGSAAVVALAAGWAAGMVNPTFGMTVMLGGIAYAGNQILNDYLPNVGSVTGLSGLRYGLGDFVPGRFTVPQNPVMDGNPQLPTAGALMSGAYAPAYRVS